MAGKISSGIFNLAGRLPFPMSACKRFLKRDLVGFSMHVIADKPPPHIKHIYPCKSAARFESDLRFLKKQFIFVPYKLLAEHHAGGKPLPENAAIMTFDDGYAECFSHARPILLKHEIPCIFFINESFIDNRRMFLRNKMSLCAEKILSLPPDERRRAIDQVNDSLGLRNADSGAFIEWLRSLYNPFEKILDETCRILNVDIAGYLAEKKPYLTIGQIKQMTSEGFTFGGHTKTHPKLQNINKKDEIEEEIIGSCEFVKTITGQDKVPFAFPYTSAGIDVDILKYLLINNDIMGLLFDTQMLRKSGNFIYNRIPLDGTERGAARILRSAYFQQMARQIIGRS